MFSKQVASSMDVPVIADSVDSPMVIYGRGWTSINFLAQDGRYGRVTFEKLDSIRVSRGEYSPYPMAPEEPPKISWVKTVANSIWLRERYEYEKHHYGKAYNFGGNVEEMMTDFSHYVFEFHDEFVEVLCAGIWIESAVKDLGDLEPESNHPLRPLSDSTITERFEGHGIVCQVRRNPLSSVELQRNAKLCSQQVLAVAAELDGHASIHWTLSLRELDGALRCTLRSHFGKEVQKYDYIPALAEIKPHIDAWLAEVKQRRVKRGKE